MRGFEAEEIFKHRVRTDSLPAYQVQRVVSPCIFSVSIESHQRVVVSLQDVEIVQCPSVDQRRHVL